MTTRRDHWEDVYRSNDPTEVGWYQDDPSCSFGLITAASPNPTAPIIDVGGGCSLLVDRLLDAGHTDVTVLDLSAAALTVARKRLGPRSNAVTWIEGDITTHPFERRYVVWHDRAVFHFLIEDDAQDAYVKQLRNTVAVDGNVVLGTFSLDGPSRCSGLPVQRYGEASMSRRLGVDFEPVRFERETHLTPGGNRQEFLFGHFKKTAR